MPFFANYGYHPDLNIDTLPAENSADFQTNAMKL